MMLTDIKWRWVALGLNHQRYVMDDLTKKHPQDSSKVNVNEPWELKYWTQKLGVTADQLRAAVRAVGVSAAAVRRHLGK